MFSCVDRRDVFALFRTGVLGKRANQMLLLKLLQHLYRPTGTRPIAKIGTNRSSGIPCRKYTASVEITLTLTPCRFHGVDERLISNQ